MSLCWPCLEPSISMLAWHFSRHYELHAKPSPEPYEPYSDPDFRRPACDPGGM